MSIQTTNYISREDAELMFISKLLDTKYNKLAKIEAIKMSNKELEDVIQTTFDNYYIKDI